MSGIINTDTKRLMDNVIQIETRSVNGNDLMYVVSEQADAIKSLTGKKTIDRHDIAALRSLGLVVEAATISLAV